MRGASQATDYTPTSVSALAADNSIVLTWSPPADTAAGDATYVARWATTPASLLYLNSGGANGEAVTGGASARSLTISGLRGVSHNAQVGGVNPAGAIFWADIVTATPNDVPSPPRDLTLSRGDARLTLSWTAPERTGGAAINNYRVRWARGAASSNWINPPGGAGRVIPGGASTLIYTLTGLAAGGTFAVQVAAENRIGTGEWSASQSARTLAPPGAPQNLRIAISDATLMLTWDIPTDTGDAAISDYKVRWAQGAGSSTWIDPPGEAGESAGLDLTHSISSLTNGTTYEVQVAAINAYGTGEWAAARDNPARPPDLPTDVRAQLGVDFVTLSWDASANNGGDAVTGYAVRWTEIVQFGFGTWVPSATGMNTGSLDTVYVVRGLKRNTRYQLQVAAINRAGTGAFGSSVTARTTFSILDANQNGAADWRDGVLVARYLAGVRGDALIAGMGDSLVASSIIEQLASGVTSGELDIDGAGGITAADGIIIARYMLNVRGAALTAGQSNVNVDTITGKIEALLP